MGTSSRALTVLALATVANGYEVISERTRLYYAQKNPGYRTKVDYAALGIDPDARQFESTVCTDLGRVDGMTYWCMRKTDTIADYPYCDATIPSDGVNPERPNTIQNLALAESFCCNASLVDPQGVLPLPKASQGACCPATPDEYIACGTPSVDQTLFCCHPTEERCETELGPDFIEIGECVAVSEAPTAPTAPTSSPTMAPTTASPTGSPTTGSPTVAVTESPTASPTWSDFLSCPGVNGAELFPVQADNGDFVTCGCAASCPSGSYCSFQTDTGGVTGGYCCPGAKAASTCDSQSCSNCTGTCEWNGILGCIDTPGTTESCATCPDDSGNTGGDGDAENVNTGVPGSCVRRCGTIGSARMNSRPPLYRDLDPEDPSPLKWLYQVPHVYDPYFNMYGTRMPPPPPPPLPPPPLPPPPMMPPCSCDDKCLDVEFADCCADYEAQCVM